MTAASDAKIARRVSTCLALPLMLCVEVRVAGSTKRNSCRARCLKTFLLLGKSCRISPAVIARAQHNASLFEARACARLAKARGVGLLNLKARSARFQSLQMLCFVKSSKERSEAAIT